MKAETVHLDYGGMLTVTAPQMTGNPAGSVYDFTGGVHAHANDTTLHSESLLFQGAKKPPSGQVETPQTITAQHALLYQRPFTLRAPQITFQPDLTTATHASLTTANPGDKPDIEMRAGTLYATPLRNRQGVLTGRQHLDMRSASLYLLHNRIITLRRLQMNVGPRQNKNRRPRPHPTFGYSQNYGYFVGYGSGTTISKYPLLYNVVVPQRSQPQIMVSSDQILYSGPGLRQEVSVPPSPPLSPPLAALRLATTALTQPLPPGDPLLYHDFLPGGNRTPLFNPPWGTILNLSEQVNDHVPALGTGLNNLYVSSYPDVTLSGITPLTRAYSLPPPGNPTTFRHFLRHFVVDGFVGADLGHFYEQAPRITIGSNSVQLPDTDAYRARYSVGLFTQPWLIAHNTVLSPSINYITNRYSGTRASYNLAQPSRSYSFSQVSVGVDHFFSDFSALGVRYTQSQVHGATPFFFDALPSSREVDGRLQIGNHRLALAASVSYDLVASRTINYTFAIAPGLHGITPVISYQYFTRSIGINFEVPGLSF